VETSERGHGRSDAVQRVHLLVAGDELFNLDDARAHGETAFAPSTRDGARGRKTCGCHSITRQLQRLDTCDRDMRTMKANDDLATLDDGKQVQAGRTAEFDGALEVTTPDLDYSTCHRVRERRLPSALAAARVVHVDHRRRRFRWTAEDRARSTGRVASNATEQALDIAHEVSGRVASGQAVVASSVTRVGRTLLDVAEVDTTPLRTLVEAHRQEIKAIVARHRGRSIALFGSVARGEERGDSDIDFLVELEPDARPIEILSIGVELEEALGVKVDVGTPASLRERVRDEVLAEAVLL
jgi:uncharacterized protein